MPELPEVEATRLSLASRIEGAAIVGVHLGKPLRWPLGVDPSHLPGHTVGVLQRRGKYLWMPLLAQAPASLPQDQAQASGLLLHLGMSGALRFDHPAVLPARGQHDHFELTTDRGTLRLTDPRRFGAVVWSPGLNVAPASTLLARLGVEPLSDAFSADVLRVGFSGRRVAVKQALLAGDVVVGVGNIYCSEALFRAGIHPLIPAHRIGPQRLARLATAIRETLSDALRAGGSTLRDFSNAHGMAGTFQQLAQVYDREGLPCVRCAGTVRRILQGQRATYFCARCQRT